MRTYQDYDPPCQRQVHRNERPPVVRRRARKNKSTSRKPQTTLTGVKNSLKSSESYRGGCTKAASNVTLRSKTSVDPSPSSGLRKRSTSSAMAATIPPQKQMRLDLIGTSPDHWSPSNLRLSSKQKFKSHEVIDKAFTPISVRLSITNPSGDSSSVPVSSSTSASSRFTKQSPVPKCAGGSNGVTDEAPASVSVLVHICSDSCDSRLMPTQNKDKVSPSTSALTQFSQLPIVKCTKCSSTNDETHSDEPVSPVVVAADLPCQSQPSASKEFESPPASVPESCHFSLASTENDAEPNFDSCAVEQSSHNVSSDVDYPVSRSPNQLVPNSFMLTEESSDDGNFHSALSLTNYAHPDTRVSSNDDSACDVPSDGLASSAPLKFNYDSVQSRTDEDTVETKNLEMAITNSWFAEVCSKYTDEEFSMPFPVENEECRNHVVGVDCDAYNSVHGNLNRCTADGDKSSDITLTDDIQQQDSEIVDNFSTDVRGEEPKKKPDTNDQNETTIIFNADFSCSKKKLAENSAIVSSIGELSAPIVLYSESDEDASVTDNFNVGIEKSDVITKTISEKVVGTDGEEPVVIEDGEIIPLDESMTSEKLEEATPTSNVANNGQSDERTTTNELMSSTTCSKCDDECEEPTIVEDDEIIPLDESVPVEKSEESTLPPNTVQDGQKGGRTTPNLVFNSATCTKNDAEVTNNRNGTETTVLANLVHSDDNCLPSSKQPAIIVVYSDSDEDIHDNELKCDVVKSDKCVDKRHSIVTMGEPSNIGDSSMKPVEECEHSEEVTENVSDRHDGSQAVMVYQPNEMRNEDKCASTNNITKTVKSCTCITKNKSVIELRLGRELERLRQLYQNTGCMSASKRSYLFSKIKSLEYHLAQPHICDHNAKILQKNRKCNSTSKLCTTKKNLRRELVRLKLLFTIHVDPEISRQWLLSKMQVIKHQLSIHTCNLIAASSKTDEDLRDVNIMESKESTEQSLADTETCRPNPALVTDSYPMNIINDRTSSTEGLSSENGACLCEETTIEDSTECKNNTSLGSDTDPCVGEERSNNEAVVEEPKSFSFRTKKSQWNNILSSWQRDKKIENEKKVEASATNAESKRNCFQAKIPIKLNLKPRSRKPSESIDDPTMKSVPKDLDLQTDFKEVSIKNPVRKLTPIKLNLKSDLKKRSKSSSDNNQLIRSRWEEDEFSTPEPPAHPDGSSEDTRPAFENLRLSCTDKDQSKSVPVSTYFYGYKEDGFYIPPTAYNDSRGSVRHSLLLPALEKIASSYDNNSGDNKDRCTTETSAESEVNANSDSDFNERRVTEFRRDDYSRRHRRKPASKNRSDSNKSKGNDAFLAEIIVLTSDEGSKDESNTIDNSGSESEAVDTSLRSRKRRSRRSKSRGAKIDSYSSSEVEIDPSSRSRKQRSCRSSRGHRDRKRTRLQIDGQSEKPESEERAKTPPSHPVDEDEDERSHTVILSKKASLAEKNQTEISSPSTSVPLSYYPPASSWLVDTTVPFHPQQVYGDYYNSHYYHPNYIINGDGYYDAQLTSASDPFYGGFEDDRYHPAYRNDYPDCGDNYMNTEEMIVSSNLGTHDDGNFYSDVTYNGFYTGYTEDDRCTQPKSDVERKNANLVVVNSSGDRSNPGTENGDVTQISRSNNDDDLSPTDGTAMQEPETDYQAKQIEMVEEFLASLKRKETVRAAVSAEKENDFLVTKPKRKGDASSKAKVRKNSHSSARKRSSKSRSHSTEEEDDYSLVIKPKRNDHLPSKVTRVRSDSRSGTRELSKKSRSRCDPDEYRHRERVRSRSGSNPPRSIDRTRRPHDHPSSKSSSSGSKGRLKSLIYPKATEPSHAQFGSRPATSRPFVRKDLAELIATRRAEYRSQKLADERTRWDKFQNKMRQLQLRRNRLLGQNSHPIEEEGDDCVIVPEVFPVVDLVNNESPEKGDGLGNDQQVTVNKVAFSIKLEIESSDDESGPGEKVITPAAVEEDRPESDDRARLSALASCDHGRPPPAEERFASAEILSPRIEESEEGRTEGVRSAISSVTLAEERSPRTEVLSPRIEKSDEGRTEDAGSALGSVTLEEERSARIQIVSPRIEESGEGRTEGVGSAISSVAVAEERAPHIETLSPRIEESGEDRTEDIGTSPSLVAVAEERSACTEIVSPRIEESGEGRTENAENALCSVTIEESGVTATYEPCTEVPMDTECAAISLQPVQESAAVSISSSEEGSSPSKDKADETEDGEISSHSDSADARIAGNCQEVAAPANDPFAELTYEELTESDDNKSSLASDECLWRDLEKGLERGEDELAAVAEIRRPRSSVGSSESDSEPRYGRRRPTSDEYSPKLPKQYQFSNETRSSRSKVKKTKKKRRKSSSGQSSVGRKSKSPVAEKRKNSSSVEFKNLLILLEERKRLLVEREKLDKRLHSEKRDSDVRERRSSEVCWRNVIAADYQQLLEDQNECDTIEQGGVNEMMKKMSVQRGLQTGDADDDCVIVSDNCEIPLVVVDDDEIASTSCTCATENISKVETCLQAEVERLKRELKTTTLQFIAKSLQNKIKEIENELSDPHICDVSSNDFKSAKCKCDASKTRSNCTCDEEEMGRLKRRLQLLLEVCDDEQHTKWLQTMMNEVESRLRVEKKCCERAKRKLKRRIQIEMEKIDSLLRSNLFSTTQKQRLLAQKCELENRISLDCKCEMCARKNVN